MNAAYAGAFSHSSTDATYAALQSDDGVASHESTTDTAQGATTYKYGNGNGGGGSGVGIENANYDPAALPRDRVRNSGNAHSPTVGANHYETMDADAIGGSASEGYGVATPFTAPTNPDKARHIADRDAPYSM